MNLVKIDEAIKILEDNKVVSIPTETVYGLGAMITSKEALELIFKIKERPYFDPLIVHVSNITMAKTLTTSWNSICDSLSKHFWPGPLTLILEKSTNVLDIITADSNFVGIRMPRHKITLELIEKLGVPIAAPSANKFKKTSPTLPDHVFEEFGKIVPIINGGPTNIGIESTVARIEKNKISIYRPGNITKEMIEDALEQDGITGVKVLYEDSPISPGNLKEHYRPKSPLILFSNNSNKENYKEELSKANINLEEVNNFDLPYDSEEAAKLIYTKMRELSKGNPPAISFTLPSDAESSEAWRAVLNRLMKASSFNFLSYKNK